MSGTVSIVGATGMLGAPVARRMLSDGWRVRCLVRDETRARARLGAAFDYVTGDVTRPETLRSAFDDCDAVHLNLRGDNTLESYERVEVEGAAHCIEVARRAGVSRISYLSGAGRSGAALAHHFPVRVKTAVERALAASGLGWTVFRATHFMESLPQFVRDGRAAVLGRQPHRLHYVAAADYARMVSMALRTPETAHRALYVLGPEGLTMREALSRFLAVRHPELRAQTLPLPIARIVARLSRNRDLAFACELFAAFAAIGEDGDAGFTNSVLGKPETTLEQWLHSPPA